ncbi:MAG: hypothetical protein WAO95_17510 [Burkholderiales bacterium]
MNVERFEAARVAALFRVARPAYFATIALGALLLLVLWGAFPAGLLTAWLGAIVALTLARRAHGRGCLRWAHSAPARSGPFHRRCSCPRPSRCCRSR